MRSTIKIASNNALNNILDNYARVLKVQNQMGRGKRVINPSDDPLATNAAMRLDTTIARIEQFNLNIEVGNGFLGLSDAALSDVNSILKTAKSLTIGAASDTTTQEMRRTNAVEMNNLLKELVNIGNRSDGTRHLFGGTETQKDPFEVVAGRYVNYRGNENDIDVQVDPSIYMPINITGEEVYGSMLNIVESRDLSPDVNMGIGTSTRLEDLNQGQGIASGSINVKFTASSNQGLDIDLTSADTMEDVKDRIEQASIEQANTHVQGTDPEWNYVLRAFINPDHNGLEIQEWTRTSTGPTTWVYNTQVTLPDPNASALAISEVGNNTVARNLGILGTGTTSGLSELVGEDLDPRLQTRTLLSDLEDWADDPFTITNGGLPGQVSVREFNDTQNYTSNWSLTGLTSGTNAGRDGELYTEITSLGGGQYQVDVYKDPEREAQDRVASGTGSSGTIVLQEQNNSGLTGSVGFNPPAIPPATPIQINMQVITDPNFQATINTRAFEKTGDASNQLDEFRLRGLTPEMFDSMDGEIHLEMEDTGGGPGPVEVRMHVRDETTGAFTQIGSGLLGAGLTEGVIELQGAPGTIYESLVGSVYVDYQADELLPAANADPAVGSAATRITPTWNTVGDLIREIESVDTYTRARIDERGEGIEIISTLGGAHLTVTENADRVAHYNDNGMLGEINLSNVITGTNTDNNGRVYANITSDNSIPPNTTVDLYSVNPTDGAFDADKHLVGQATYSGNVPVGGAILAIQPQNNSSLTGTIELLQIDTPKSGLSETSLFDLDASVGQQNLERAVVLDTQAYRTDQSISPNGDAHDLLYRMNMEGVVQGVNSGPDGNLYTTVGFTATGETQVTMYSDSARTLAVAQGTATGSGGQVVMNELNDSGIFGEVYVDTVINDSNSQIHNLQLNGVTAANTDVNGMLYMEVVAAGAGFDVNVYSDLGLTTQVAQGSVDMTTGQVALDGTPFASGISGSLRVADPVEVLPVVDAGIQIRALPTDNTLTVNPPRGFQNSDQVREQNIFSTFNDVIDALLANDSEDLGGLIGNYAVDLDRVLLGRSEIGSRQNRLEMLTNRHEDEKLNFGQIRSDRVDLDFSEAIVEFQAQQNVFEAALRTTGQLIPLSLVDFI